MLNDTRYRIQFPQDVETEKGQDEVSFTLMEKDGSQRELRFHDYDAIFRRPGLYEQLFYDRLHCTSPTKVAEILAKSMDQASETMTSLRVLDLGAGNGMMGEALGEYGVARMIGADIIPEARVATERDRPQHYDDYFVTDFTRLTAEETQELKSWHLNCLTCVAALGFGDIPPKAFMTALNATQTEAWVAFNIKDTFLDKSDETGFSRMIRDLIFSEYLELFHLEKYCHRLSIEGVPLFYYAVAAKKTSDVPGDWMDAYLD